MKLKQFLADNPDWFCGANSVDTINDVVYFKIKKPQNIIFVGGLFLCDIYPSEIWIVELLPKARFDRKTKRKSDIKPVYKLFDDAEYYFSRFNGYWKIPERFYYAENWD